MAAKTKTKGIVFNIPNVSSSTKIGDLTVDQFIQLLLQFREQLALNSELNTKLLDAVTNQIKQQVEKDAKKRKGSPLDAIVSEHQKNILAQMPNALRKRS